MTAELRSATVIRGRKAILDTASFACEAGKFTAFCGPNGAGKTTALSVLTGALKPESGSAHLEGHAVGSVKPIVLAKRRAVVSQVSQLAFPFLVHEVVAMGRAPHYGTAGQLRDDDIIRDAMGLMELMPFAERNYLTLSGGERQRANIARALAQVWDPPEDGGSRWLFLDEPTAALDLKYQIALMHRLGDLAADGWGVVAVLHDLQLVKDHADRVVMFKDGKVAGIGAAGEMLVPDRIQTAFDLDAPYALA
ncbi:MAG: ATP-binding cassette domain-containing protein [Pseudomonadota bacterium]